MASYAESVEEKPDKAEALVLVFDDNQSLEIVSKLKESGYQAKPGDRQFGISSLLQDAEPGVIVFVRNDRERHSPVYYQEICTAARRLSTPLLLITPAGVDFSEFAHDIEKADEWLTADRIGVELKSRIATVLARTRRRLDEAPPSTVPAADSNFFSLVIHDLRTPLNVIGLSLRMISQAVPKGDPDLDEDLRFVEENFGQIERMLMQLSDYFRLFENIGPLSPIDFSPRRAVDELIASRSNKPALRFGNIELVVKETCPEVLSLDPLKARLALSYVLANATTSAGNTPIQLTLSSKNGHFIAETTIENPPPASVRSTTLSPLNFMRLCGFAAERRGMDLAIAAKVSEMFGGSARLDVYENKKTSVVLEWPFRLPESPH